MLRLKILDILESWAALNTLLKSKLMINTINAHSYNTALKIMAFAEVPMKEDVLSIAIECQKIKSKSQPKERSILWSGIC